VQSYWEIQIFGVKVNGQELSANPTCSAQNPCNGIVDTGTSLILAPQGTVTNLQNIIPVALLSSNQVTACNSINLNALPNITFNLGGVLLSIPPSIYILNDGQNNCNLGIDVGGTLWIMGDTLIRNFYTIFDRGNNQVGFAALVGNPPLAPSQSMGNGPTMVIPAPSISGTNKGLPGPVQGTTVAAVNAQLNGALSTGAIGGVVGSGLILVVIVIVLLLVWVTIRNRRDEESSKFDQHIVITESQQISAPFATPPNENMAPTYIPEKSYLPQRMPPYSPEYSTKDRDTAIIPK